MASSRILSSKAVDKLQVNRLDAQEIRSYNISGQNPQYLFSAVFNNGNFTRDSTGGTLTFTRSDVDSIIQFSDRPFRQTDNISFEEFVSLFGITDSGSNTFAEDPPNAVLVHEEEQRTYIVRLASSDSNSVTFNLELLPGESHNLENVNGRMSFFVDNQSTPTPLKQLPKLVRNNIYNVKVRGGGNTTTDYSLKFTGQDRSIPQLFFDIVPNNPDYSYYAAYDSLGNVILNFSNNSNYNFFTVGYVLSYNSN